MILTGSTTFSVVASSPAVAEASFVVLPSVSFPSGSGRIVHPTLGAFDYDVKPDQWVNLDGDVIVAPTWASTKTLKGASNSLWQGNIRDVVCEERWGINQGGLSMPVDQFRTLLAIWTNPIDPSVGYVQWFPNYATSCGFNVLPVDLVIGSAGTSAMARMAGVGYQVIVLDDVIHALDNEGNPGGWITSPVTFFMKLVSKING